MHTLLLLALAAVDPAAPPPAAAPALVWQDAPPTMQKGTRMAIVSGDPKGTGPFVMRLQLPKDFALGPHTHPADENVTVIEGVVGVGFGDVVTADGARLYKAGEGYTNPKDKVHFVWAKDGAVIEIRAEAPWQVIMTHADAPAAPASTPQVMGSLDKDIIRRAIRDAAPAIKRCGTAAYSQDAGMHGKLKASFVIGGDGAVTDVTLQESGWATPEMQDCLTHVIRDLKFPAPKGGGIVKVTYPFVFPAQKTGHMPKPTAPAPKTP